VKGRQKRGEGMDMKLLIKRAKKGDKDALVELVMAQKSDYYKLAYVYMKNQNDALDATEDMIVILYENIHKLKNEDSFYTWSKTILVNCCKKMLGERIGTTVSDYIEEKGHDGGIGEKDNQLLIEKYMSELDEKQREAIRLRYLLDLEYKTIAQMLNVPLGTVKSRISNGISRLQDMFGGDIGE